MLRRFTRSKRRLPAQQALKKINENIMQNKDLFPSGSLKSCDEFFLNVYRKRKFYEHNYLLDLNDGGEEAMKEVIKYYRDANCIDGENKLSTELLDYLTSIKEEIKKYSPQDNRGRSSTSNVKGRSYISDNTGRSSLTLPTSSKVNNLSTSQSTLKTLNLGESGKVTIYIWSEENELIKKKYPDIEAGSLEISKKKSIFQRSKTLLPTTDQVDDYQKFFYKSVYLSMLKTYLVSNEIHSTNVPKEFFDILKPIISSMMVLITDLENYDENFSTIFNQVYTNVVEPLTVGTFPPSLERDFLYTIFTYMENDETKKKFQNFFDYCYLTAMENRIPESGPVPQIFGIVEFNNPIYKTQQIQQKFREKTGNP